MSVPILLYHHIDEPPPRGVPARGNWVRPARFAAQMRLLKMLGIQGLSLKEAMPYIRGEKSGKVAVITFDDGAFSVYKNAMPVLDKYGFTATNFFVCDTIGRVNEWDKPPCRSAPLMTSAEMRNWAAHGHEAGGHSLTHPHLSHLPLPDAEKEIALSKQKLEDVFGFAVTSFAFPYGDENQIIQNFVRDAGYLCAVTTKRGHAGARHSAFALPRHSVRRNDNLLNFAAKCLWRKNS